MLRIVIISCLALVAAPLQAKWYEASSDNFVIYADDSEKDIRRFAENLEKYHSAMEFVLGREVEAPSPSNRVVIFVVGSQRSIYKLTGDRNVGGFYVPRAGASRAFVQTIRDTNGYPDYSTVILLHEYAHHFLMSSSPYAMPRWLNEGWAEFFAAAGFERDGTVIVGRPALHRAGDLAYAKDVTVNQLLDPALYKEPRGKRYDAFYAKSWALVHYLNFNQERRGQMAAYQQALIDGISLTDAARQAFGDIDKLDDEIDDYVKERKMWSFNLKPHMIDFGEITLRELPRGEADMMDVRVVSQRGVSREEALELLDDARKIAAKYPDDPGVQTALAEAEFDAGNDEEAIAAADRAITLDPDRRNAYVQKGYALFRKAENAEDTDAAYAAAMKPFSALNKIEPDHPMPLIYYFRSFAERGIEPSETAKHALERAAQLAPFDHGLAMNTALMFAQEGKIGLARATLKPLAANPHGGGLAETAQTFMDEMDGADEGTKWTPPVRVITTALQVEEGEKTDSEE